MIDDSSGRTLAAVAWFEPELRGLGKAEAATRAGQLLAERAKAAGVSEAVFDRGGYRYHGHVRALAESIRESGLTVWGSPLATSRYSLTALFFFSPLLLFSSSSLPLPHHT